MTRLHLAIALVATMVIGMTGLASPVSAGNAQDLLPDLEMTPLYGVSLSTSPAGHKKLRFGTVVENVGDGPIEIRASHRDGKLMTTVKQWVYSGASGPGRGLSKPHAAVRYSGDGHDHFHVQRFIRAQLTPIDPPGASGVRSLRKIGFCLVDSVELEPGTDAAYIGCGSLSSASVKIGISVGWGDIYPPFFAHQAIDVTGLPAGSYLLCATVNPTGLWTEKGNNSANNSYWVQMDLDAANDEITVTGDGAGPC